ncbi:hypothetical protein MLD38_014948 [Melastoma candidum]|nr:hypothetical protein MLD38_014948 [Melastoma candidum]
MKFFPRIYPWNGERGAVGEDYGIQQVFYDRSMKSWNFRYCYWSSSHSFVFTKGWNHFVKEKELRSGDVVMFYECSCHDHDGREEKKFYMIDVVKRVEGNIDVKTTDKCSDSEDATDGDGDGSPDVKNGKQQGFKLFGVEIVQKSL